MYHFQWNALSIVDDEANAYKYFELSYGTLFVNFHMARYVDYILRQGECSFHWHHHRHGRPHTALTNFCHHNSVSIQFIETRENLSDNKLPNQQAVECRMSPTRGSISEWGLKECIDEILYLQSWR